MVIRALDQVQEEMRGCRRCLEAGFEITPGAVFTGRATAEVMVIGQAPGVTEVAAGRPFNASSGRRLFQWLSDAGWEDADFRGRHYMTAVTKCFPGKSASGRGDRVPSKEEQALCRSFLEQEVRFIAPATLPGELYGDASHPLPEGYQRLAEQISVAPEFQLWSGR